MRCKNCGADVSDREDRCPYCDSLIPKIEYVEEEEYEEAPDEEYEEASEEEYEEVPEEEYEEDAEEEYEDSSEEENEEPEEDLDARIDARIQAARDEAFQQGVEAAESASRTSQEGLSVFSWIGGVILVIIGFCCGVLPGIGVIFLLDAAHSGPGFARSFLRVLNVILYLAIALIIFGIVADLKNY